jgi:hypothetical protein
VRKCPPGSGSPRSTPSTRSAATEATAATVSDIRPLTLPDERSTARQRRPALRHAWGGWLIPVAAAVAVVVLAAVLVAVRDLPGFGHAAGVNQVTTGGAASLPTYGAVLTETTVRLPADVGSGDTVANNVTVFDTRTGKQVTTVKAPAYTSGSSTCSASIQAAHSRPS